MCVCGCGCVCVCVCVCVGGRCVHVGVSDSDSYASLMQISKCIYNVLCICL